MLATAGSYGQRVQRRLSETLRKTALLNSLELAIDAGDVRCYSGNGQAVFDVSHHAYDFTLGKTSSAEATDPVFAGIAGRQSAGEYFRNTAYTMGLWSPLTTFSNSMHKDNALFGFAGWWRMSQVDLANGGAIFQTGSATNVTGIEAGSIVSSGKFGFECAKTGPTVVLDIDSGLACIAAVPTFYAMSYNEASGAWIMQVNGNQATGTATYSSPATGDTDTGIAFITNNDAVGGYSGDFFNGSVWSRAPSAAELMSLFNAQRQKFGV